jgi:microsomal dipeptidase-like Zn-dependent dipeptidase
MPSHLTLRDLDETAVSREYSDAEIKKVIGENVVRVMAQIEK